MTGGLVAGFMAAVVLASITPGVASASSTRVWGAVRCNSGLPVAGIWVESSGPGSGWAGWTPQPGNPSVAQYARTLESNATVRLHVGCGNPQNWSSDNLTPPIAIGAGRAVNAFCNDNSSPHQAQRCSFPTRGSTRSYNSFGYGYCTYGAAVKFREYVGAFPGWNGDAKAWATAARNAGWTVTSTPVPHSVFVFQPGSGTNDSRGHVGWVDEVVYQGGRVYLRTTEMNTRGWNRWSNEFREVPANAQFILTP